MSTLNAADRKKMPKSEFGLPASKGFPMNDPTHQRMAISGATRSEHAGNISASTAARIKATARKKLDAGKSKASTIGANMMKSGK